MRNSIIAGIVLIIAGAIYTGFIDECMTIYRGKHVDARQSDSIAEIASEMKNKVAKEELAFAMLRDSVTSVLIIKKVEALEIHIQRLDYNQVKVADAINRFTEQLTLSMAGGGKNRDKDTATMPCNNIVFIE